MIINMTTFAGRKEHYIHRTLESLFRSDGRDLPVNLILGSSDTSHVEQYRNVANIVTWDEEAERQARGHDRRRYCNINAIRAIKYGDDEYCLCCEDDIVFDATWYHQLLLTIAQIDRKDYVLNLSQGCDQSPDKRYVTHTPSYLCGAQAIFYPSKMLRIAAALYLEHNMRGGMNDALVGAFAKKYAALYNTTPLLVHHIGQVSSFTEDPSSTQPEPKGSKPKAPEKLHPERPAQRVARPSVSQDPASERATREILVALLRASLGTGERPQATRLAECDWPRFERVAMHHGLIPILYRALVGLGNGVPAERLRKFKLQYVATTFHGQLAKTCVHDVGTAFGAEQIPVVVMKGAALQQTLYDDPGLRILGDVDLLVEERDVERAGAQLQGMGFNLVAADPAAERGPLCHIHRIYAAPQPRAMPVELHWRLFEPYQPYVFDLDAVRAQARHLSGMPPNVLIMAREHELAHLCVHLDRHAEMFRSLLSREDWLESLLLPQGLGRLQWLYDIAFYLQRHGEGINWDSFVDTARRWALDGRVYATLELSRRALGVGPPPEVLRALDCGRPRFVERVAHRVVMESHRANEAQNNGPAEAQRARRLTRLSGNVLRFTHTWISVFPPSAYLRAKYAGSGGSPWLRGRHLREVVPGLWAETRQRSRAAGALRSHAPQE